MLSSYWMKNTDYLTQIPLRPLKTLFQLRRRTESHRPWGIHSPFSRTLLQVIIVLLVPATLHKLFPTLEPIITEISALYSSAEAPNPKKRAFSEAWGHYQRYMRRTKSRQQSPAGATITPSPGSFKPARTPPTLSLDIYLEKTRKTQPLSSESQYPSPVSTYTLPKGILTVWVSI